MTYSVDNRNNYNFFSFIVVVVTTQNIPTNKIIIMQNKQSRLLCKKKEVFLNIFMSLTFLNSKIKEKKKNWKHFIPPLLYAHVLCDISKDC